MAPDPVKYSRQAVATIGVQDVTGGWMAHDLQVLLFLSFFISLPPLSLNSGILLILCQKASI